MKWQGPFFLSLFLGLLLEAPTLKGQAASYSFVGKDCGNSSVQMLEVQGVPKLGTTFFLITSGSNHSNPIAWTSNFLFTGISNTNFGGLKLPFDLAKLSTVRNTFCGILRNDILVVNLAPEGIPRPKYPIVIPQDKSLIGLRFYHQAFRLMGFYDLRTQRWTYFYDISREGIAVVGT